MAGTSIQTSLEGDFSEFARRIDRLVNFDFTGLHRALGAALVNESLEAFRTGTSPDGKAWPESGRVTRYNAGRRRKAKGKTLVDTGRLRNSVHMEASADQVEVGTDVIYARIHQFGGETGRGHATSLPPRPYLPVDEKGDLAPKTRDLLQKIIEAHIEEALQP